MKFIKNPTKQPSKYPVLTSITNLENFIESTKLKIDNLLAKQNHQKRNISTKEQKALKELRNPVITIKPADKNLGTVILNSADYVEQCLLHLVTDTYQRVTEFPTNKISKDIQNTLISFKEHLTLHPQLYQFLQPKNEHTIPKFYGLPKIHKPLEKNGIPPIRPIVSHSNSLLSRTASLIDHSLQPLARSYEDFLNNSTQLIKELDNLTIPTDTLLVTLDVNSLYPSIPQEECITIIHQEMLKNQDLIIFDPNLITKLLHTNMTNNYFDFAETFFLQKTGIAMGASFSPTAANIFMSVTLSTFLNSRQETPLYLKRYIDDIFLIWPKNQDLPKFLNELNNYHPNLKFTATFSETAVNFLDVTIFKGKRFNQHNRLDMKTYQKENNLYEYIHFQSNHQKQLLKGFIIGETIRYVRTNTSEDSFTEQSQRLTSRLQERKYPLKLVKKCIARVSYRNRDHYLEDNTIKLKPSPPKLIFKSITPPHYQNLKLLILNEFTKYGITDYTQKPLFITVKNTNFRNILVKAKHKPTDRDNEKIQENTRTADYQNPITPPKSPLTTKPNKCNLRRCATCTHFNTDNYFQSTITNERFRIRFPFSCSSSNIIYLITCKKCKKQYVGQTIKTLRERIYHHRSSIRTSQGRYISKHFSLPGHNISDLTVQVIDRTTNNEQTKLHEREQFWIKRLTTLQPNGLNVAYNQQTRPAEL